MKALKSISFSFLIISALTLSGCSKKSRCADCPKFSKAEVKISGTRI